MQRRDSRLLLSATDLVNFHECEHLSALDRAALDDEALKAQRTKPDDQAELLFRKGREFEASYLEELKRLHPGAGEVVEIANPFKDPGKAAAETLAAMRAGASIIYQATFVDGDLLASVQQAEPHEMHVMLGTREQVSFTCSEYSRYFSRLLHGDRGADRNCGKNPGSSDPATVYRTGFYSDSNTNSGTTTSH